MTRNIDPVIVMAVLETADETKNLLTNCGADGSPHPISALSWNCGCKALSLDESQMPVIPCEEHVATFDEYLAVPEELLEPIS